MKWTHRDKNKKLYRIVGEAKLQCVEFTGHGDGDSNNLFNDMQMIVYQSEDGQNWVMSREDFESGRFVKAESGFIEDGRTKQQKNFTDYDYLSSDELTVTSCPKCKGTGRIWHPIGEYKIECPDCSNGMVLGGINWWKPGDHRHETIKVIGEIVAERQRQIMKEGWTIEHDDGHVYGGLAMAAALYASPEPDLKLMKQRQNEIAFIDPWPWLDEDNNRAWYKPKARRHDLIRAAALIVAEIERLDRIPVASSADDGTVRKTFYGKDDYLRRTTHD